MADEKPVLRALGWLLVVLGGLWTALTGCCTLLFVGGSVWSAMTTSGNGDGGMLGAALTIGTICIVPGALILWAGIAIVRRKPKAGGA